MCLSTSYCSISVLLVYSAIIIFNVVSASDSDKCGHCRSVTKAFHEGMDKTKNKNPGGGNTDWEKRNLREFKTSDIRFDEVMDLVFVHEYGGKSIQFKSNAFAEEYEEDFKEWFLKFQDTNPNFFEFICVDRLELCCPDGYYGSNCDECPGLLPIGNNNKRECSGRGTCNGSGTRGGTGACECSTGYVGKICSNCDSHYFSVTKNTTYVECAECFDGCASGCTAAGPKACLACRTGYSMDEETGCIDIDECALDNNEKKCTKTYEVCKNTAGSYHCECDKGYRRNSNNDKCELDVEASPIQSIIKPDALLRIFAIFALFGITCFVLLFHRSPLAVGLTIMGIVAAVFVENYYELIIPKAAWKFFEHQLS